MQTIVDGVVPGRQDQDETDTPGVGTVHMPHLNRRPLLVATAAAIAAAAPAFAHPTQDPSHNGIFEQKLTHDAHYAEGEPSIAINPRNQRNMILTFLANTGFGAYGAQNNTTPTTRDFEETIQACDYLVTFNGGRTWERGTLPIANFDIDPTRPNCSDTLVQFDKRGVAYVVGSSYQFPTFTVGEGDFRMISSRDGGRTWSKPSVVAPALLSPSPDFSKWQGVRFYDDREFMALDDSTHTIYVTGTQGRLDATGSAGHPVPHRIPRRWQDVEQRHRRRPGGVRPARCGVRHR